MLKFCALKFAHKFSSKSNDALELNAISHLKYISASHIVDSNESYEQRRPFSNWAHTCKHTPRDLKPFLRTWDNGTNGIYHSDSHKNFICNLLSIWLHMHLPLLGLCSKNLVPNRYRTLLQHENSTSILLESEHVPTSVEALISFQQPLPV